MTPAAPSVEEGLYLVFEDGQERPVSVAEAVAVMGRAGSAPCVAVSVRRVAGEAAPVRSPILRTPTLSYDVARQLAHGGAR